MQDQVELGRLQTIDQWHIKTFNSFQPLRRYRDKRYQDLLANTFLTHLSRSYPDNLFRTPFTLTATKCHANPIHPPRPLGVDLTTLASTIPFAFLPVIARLLYLFIAYLPPFPPLYSSRSPHFESGLLFAFCGRLGTRLIPSVIAQSTPLSPRFRGSQCLGFGVETF
ncbi:hypothetical protein BDV96DRAFT_121524 [Lophiotrema nucula]|uniref:Uncharacterized protein n=1 Tax=Lophiotrema nucula TaxID=690887 RepID=A0A6A5Z4I1_9PLEO|nr:hypothetical protein BDV96DRAFT_121524 [Lophiotrema nucula]